MAGRNKHVHWHEDLTEEDYRAWHEEDPEGFRGYVTSKFTEFQTIAKTLKAGEPHPLTFEQGASDPGYQRALSDFKESQLLDGMETAVGLALLKTRPKTPTNPDIQALGSRNPTDRATASEVFQFRDAISRLEQKAKHFKNNGYTREAMEAGQMAAGYQGHVDRLYREQPYSFVEEGRRAHLEETMKELEAASNLSPKEIEQNHERWTGLVESYNLSNDAGDHSFVLNGPSPYDPDRPSETRIMRVDHEGTSGTRMAQSRNGLSTLDTLIKQGFGRAAPTVKEKATEETEEDDTYGQHPLDDASTDEIKEVLTRSGVALF